MADLDQLPEEDREVQESNEVVDAALELLTEANDIKSEKEITVEKSKDLIKKLLSGEDPEKIDQFISYLPLILINIFTTLYKVPDTRVVRTGYNEAIETLMSAFLEKVVKDAGFNEMMEQGFGGAYQAGAYGDFYVLGMAGVLDGGGKKIKKGENFIDLQGLSIGNAFFNREATSIRKKYVSQDLSRFGIITEMNIFEAERMLPGLLKGAKQGRIPNGDTETSPTNHKSDVQDSFDNKLIEILYFYDKAHGIFSIIAGSNSYEYKRVEGKEFENAFTMKYDGKQQIVLPIGGFGLEPRPEGIYNSGLPETFWRLIDLDGKMSTSLANNVLESNLSPEMWNIEDVDAADLLTQITRGKREKERGNRPVIIPKSGKNGQSLGQSTVGYLKPNELSGENDSLEAKILQVFRRMGWDVDFNFTDSQKTLGQSEIDLSKTTKKVSSIQDSNLDFYKFVYYYALDKIIKLGNEKDDTIWGGEVEIDVNGELVSIDELAGEEITIGFIVGLFRKAKDRIEIEIDTENGVVFNDALERRAAEREFANAAPGSVQQLRASRRLSIINGGGKIKMSDLLGKGGEAPQPPQPSQPVADQL